MLPFLDAKKVAAGSVSRRVGKKDLEVKSEVDSPSNEKMPEGLQSVAEEMLKAVNEKSVLGIAKCFKNAFEILESQPHDEAEGE